MPCKVCTIGLGGKTYILGQNLSNHNYYVYFKILSNHVDYDTQNVFMYYYSPTMIHLMYRFLVKRY